MGCFGAMIASSALTSLVALVLLLGLWRGDWTTVREEIVDELIVSANRSTVWNVLMDWEAYDDWNSAITKVEGNQTTASRFVVHYREVPYFGLAGRILANFHEEKLRWMHAPFYLHGFLTTEHTVILTSVGDKTKLHSAFYLRGIFVSYLFPFFGDSMDAAIVQTNQEIKLRAEKIIRETSK